MFKNRALLSIHFLEPIHDLCEREERHFLVSCKAQNPSQGWWPCNPRPPVGEGTNSGVLGLCFRGKNR
jgi:hypothetical protein